MKLPHWSAVSLAAPFLLGACAGGGGRSPTAPAPSGPVATRTAAEPGGPPAPTRPVAPYEVARQLGLMPVASTGVVEWRIAHPAWDGRGVLVAILDSGVDVGAPGLQTTATGERKVLDLRDLSGEGDVALVAVRADARGLIRLDDTTRLSGAASLAGMAEDSAWYGGVLRELPFGDMPASDFNGNGTNRDRYGIVVVRSGGRWIAFVDTNGDGRLSDETPLADFLVRGETFTFSSRYVPRGRGPITAAINLSDDGGRPRLSVFLDTSGHGTHVAGIAAARGIGGLQGFDGVAPGAQVLAVRIANNSRGGVTTNGSIARALDYAVRFAAERGLPLAINLSFGIGNEQEGRAVADSLVDAFVLAHPDVPFVIAAGNDGPGTSTVGLPGSAEFALAAGALYPGAFAAPQFGAPSGDVLGWWSSQGGELAKPDVLAPGVAFSTVPRWSIGSEIKVGTSMATPHLTGLTALLLSAAAQERRALSSADIATALRATARPLEGEAFIAQGAGVANVGAAWAWLSSGRRADRVRVEPLVQHDVVPGIMAGGSAHSPNVAPVRTRGGTAAYRRAGLRTPGDTIQRFRVSLVPGGGPDAAARTYMLRADADWLRAPATMTLDGVTGSAVVELRYDASRLRAPGRHVGTVAGVPAGDTAAGAAFRLVNTVIVPESAPSGAITQTGRTVGAGTVARTYVTVPAGASGLAARATVRSTAAPAELFVFEPGGRPARFDADVSMGGEQPLTASVQAEAGDLVPGVYEVAMLALPGHGVGYDLEVVVPRVRIAAIDSSSASPSVTFSAPVDTTLLVGAEQLGAATAWTAWLDHGATYTRALPVPAWVTDVVVEVRLDSASWNDVTDFSVSVVDADGDRLGGDAMNYLYGRAAVELPENRPAGYQATIELLPGFARLVPPDRFAAEVRVSFLGAPHRLGAGPAALRVPAGGTAAWAVPAVRAMADPGWANLVRVRAAASADDWVAVVRTFGVAR